jgi:hypothetical protein
MYLQMESAKIPKASVPYTCTVFLICKPIWVEWRGPFPTRSKLETGWQRENMSLIWRYLTRSNPQGYGKAVIGSGGQ